MERDWSRRCVQLFACSIKPVALACASPQPLGRYFQFAADSVGSQYIVDSSAELVRDRSGIGGEPEAPFALLERRFIASPLNEQRSQHQSVKRNHRHRRLRALDALRDRDTRVTEAAYAKGRR